jgi:ABC-type sugar transport system substrate-binding protein
MGKQKVLAAIAAALMVVSGCSSAATTAPTAAPATAAPATAAPATAAPATAAPATAAPATAAPTVAPSSASLAGMKVGWALRGFDGYQQAQAAGFKKAAEADGVQVNFVNSKDDVTAQVKAMEDWIAAGINGLVLQPVDPGAVGEVTKAARAANVPLVYVGTIPNADTAAPKAPFVPFQSMADLTKKEGADAAHWVVDTLHQTPKLVIFDWVEIPVCHEERMVPFVDGVKSVAPDAEIVFWDTVPANKDQTMAKMEDQLQRNPDFNIFTGCGGDLILGGVAGLQAAGRAKADNKQPKTEWIMTIDGTPEEINLLLDPSTSVMATIAQRPAENGGIIWDTLKKVMTGAIPADGDVDVDTGSEIMTADWGCQKISDFYTNEYGSTEIFKPIDCSKYK